MKKLITLSILLISMKGIGQTLSWITAPKTYPLTMFITYVDTLPREKQSFIRIENDTVKYINADPLVIINYFYKQTKKQDSIIEAKEAVIKAAVNLTNNIPDETLHNNCYWNKYNKLLNKEGYKTIRLKKPKQICTNK